MVHGVLSGAELGLEIRGADSRKQKDFDPSTNMQTKNFIDVGPLEDQHILAKPQEAHPGPELQLGGGPRSHTVPGGTGDGGGQELP